MPNIFITGASGFIGSRAAGAFRSQGWGTTCVGRRRVTDLADYLQQDLAQPWSTSLRQRLANADVVLHAAARSSPWGSRRQFHRDNILATENLLDACRRNGHPRLIYVSSSSVYYRPQDQMNMTEDTPQAASPVNRYARTKQQAEELIRAYEGSWVILRPRAVYGPGDTVLFPRILAAAKTGRLPLLVRGDRPVIGDLIYIDNLIYYLRCAAEAGHVTGEFNLTDNHPVAIIEFLLDVFDQLQIARPTRRLSVQSAMKMATLVEATYALCCWWKEPPITRFGVHVFAWSKTFDVSKMLQTFGAPPTTTPEGVKQFVRWIQAERPYES